MTDLETAIVCLTNEFQRLHAYRYEKYQLLHGVKYTKNMKEEHLNLLRSRYNGICLGAAYELKTYFMENGILSNTIILKMRPESSDMFGLQNSIRIHSELDGTDHEYTHHAIEIYKEHGKYKVLDVLHREQPLWLEEYLDQVCNSNHCSREQLRYDMGFLISCHAFAGNMQELVDVMRYLDKIYKIGKPKLSLMNLPEEDGDMWLSDDIIMDFEKFGRSFQADVREVVAVWMRIYDVMMKIKYNNMYLLCLGKIMRDPLVSKAMEQLLFDNAGMCRLIEESNLLLFP